MSNTQIERLGGADSPNKVKQMAVRAEKRAVPANSDGRTKTRPVVLNQLQVDKTALATVVVVTTFTEPMCPAPRR